MSPLLAELDRQTRARLAEASVRRWPLGGILSDATRRALSYEERRLARPSEVPRFFDGLTRYVQSLDTPKGAHR